MKPTTSEAAVPVSIIFKQAEFAAAVALQMAKTNASVARGNTAMAFLMDESTDQATREMRAVFSVLFYGLADAGLHDMLNQLTVLRDTTIDRLEALRAEIRAQATAFLQSGFSAVQNPEVEA